MFWDKKLETLQREDLQALQLKRLNETLLKVANSPYYKKILADLGINQFESLKDIEKLPFTSKQSLRDNFPYGFLAVDKDELRRLHSSSGTTGTPTVVFYTDHDIEIWSDMVARSMYMTGARKEDVFQNMMGYGLFTGGMGFHYASEKLGMLTVPSGPGNSERQVWFMQKFNTSVIHILPSYALHLQTYINEAGIDPIKELDLKIAFVGAEPHSEEVRKKIEDFYGIKAYNSYGLSEMCGPGVAFECQEQDGLHIWEDNFYPEIVDLKTGEVLPDGEVGELVLTTLTKEAMPLLRYRTKDITRIIPEKCSCGRTHRRIERIMGRNDDMLIINGVNIFPIQIEKVLMSFSEIGTNYRIEIVKQDFMDKLIISVEVVAEHFSGSIGQLEKLSRKIQDKLRSDLVVSPIVKLKEPGSLPVAEGKAQRVFDLRESS